MSVMSPLMLIPTQRPKQIQKKGYFPCQAINAYRAHVFAEQATVWGRGECHNRKDKGFDSEPNNKHTLDVNTTRMSYGHQSQTGQYGGGYYPNYNQQQGMYPTPPGAFAHHPHAPYPYPPQGGYHPGVSQQQGAGQPSYVPPPQFTGFFLDDYHGGDEAMDDDDDEQDEEEVVQVSE